MVGATLAVALAQFEGKSPDNSARRVQLTRYRLRSAEPCFGQVRYHFARPVVIDGAGEAHIAASSGEGQGFDGKEGFDGVCLHALRFFDQFAYTPVQVIHARVWMPPAITVGGRVKFAEPLGRVECVKQRGTGRNEQADREVDGIDMLNQMMLFKEGEQA